MATIVGARLTRAIPHPKRVHTKLSVRDRINQFVYGRVEVDCEECGRSLSSGQAVWRGAHPYCSVSHEAADSD